MKAILIAVVVVLLAAFLGWVTISNSKDKTGINIETKKIEHDTQEVIVKGKAVLDDATLKGKEILKPHQPQR